MEHLIIPWIGDGVSTEVDAKKCVTTIAVPKTGQVSDGYHTFDELYDHRITLFIALCNVITQANNVFRTPRDAWRSRLHSDGKGMEGWFIMGIGKEKGKQISYHLPMNRWEETNFAETLDRAPEWDGHTSADVLTRLKWL